MRPPPRIQDPIRRPPDLENLVGVATVPVVELFQVFANSGSDLPPRGPRTAVDQFGLQGPEEAFHHGVVPAVAPPTHTASNLVLLRQLLVVLGSILATTVQVVQQARVWLTKTQVHVASSEHQVRAQVINQGSAHDSSRKEFDDHDQVEPPIPGADIDTDRRLNLVRSRDVKVSVEEVLGNRE